MEGFSFIKKKICTLADILHDSMTWYMTVIKYALGQSGKNTQHEVNENLIHVGSTPTT